MSISISGVVIGFAILFFLLLLSVPIAWSMIIAGISGFAIVAGIEKSIWAFNYTIWSVSSGDTLACLPLFLAMGLIAFDSGMLSTLFTMCGAFIGRLKGGLAISLSISCGLFGAISGSVAATLATMAPVVTGEMGKYNYNKNFTAALLASSGTFASLIPPSITMIIYGTLTETSIAKLFMAGIVPGVLTIAIYCITTYIIIRINPKIAPQEALKTPWRKKGRLVLSNIPIGCTAFLILAGIYRGWFSPSEAGAIGLACILVIALALRKIGWKGILNSFKGSARSTAMMVFLLIGGVFLFKIIVITGTGVAASEFVSNLGLGKYGLIVAVYILFLITGCFIDAMSMMIISLPILVPVVVASGWDPVWFGVFVVKGLEIAVITPPMGLNVFIVDGVVHDKDVSSTSIFRYVFPFVLADTVVIALITAFPSICLWIPGTM